MQSFKRGMPLLPAYPNEASITDIDAGERCGLRRWVRYEPVRTKKFHLAQYLPIFMERFLPFLLGFFLYVASGSHLLVVFGRDGPLCMTKILLVRAWQE